ncbi:hypothetical protein MD484_g5027, partial [Candolleomyces efflorescens]
MSRSRIAAALVAVSASTLVASQVTGTFPPVPLASKTFASPADLPYKVDTDVGLVRGVQSGYNICNSTTENQEYLCQTAYFNSFDDWCIWGPKDPNGVVGNIEGEMIAWCSKPGHGTRLIPQGALTGLQWIQTSDYVQAVGFLDQTLVNIAEGDWGGEMDPHGADLRGNPMGGVLFSTAFGGSTPAQVIEWHNFIGGNKFCFKACDQSKPNAAHYCEHIFDRIGCDYNIPNNAVDGVFEHCKGDNQDFPGIYTENGEVKTYTQPPESLGAISTMPYQPKVPAHSECVTFSSAAVFTGLPSPTKAPGSSSSATSSGASTSGTRTGAAAGASNTGSATRSGSAAGASSTDSGAERVAIPLISAMGVIFAAVFLS